LEEINFFSNGKVNAIFAAAAGIFSHDFSSEDKEK